MVTVTRFNGSSLIINAELIETIEANPDTVIMLTSGKKWVINETPEELVDRIVQYKRRCHPDITELYSDK